MSVLDARIQALWAKSDPYHPLWCHLLDTAAVCERLMSCLGKPDCLPPLWTMYLAALHDIGKADPEFQIQDDEAAAAIRELLPMPSRRDKFRHESRSGAWVREYLTRESCHWGARATHVAAGALRGHHGNFNPPACGTDSVGYEEWNGIRAQLAQMVADVLGLQNEPFAPTEFADASSTGVKLIGLTVLSDWIASNEDLFRYPSLDTGVDPFQYWRQARLEAAHAIDYLRLGRADERLSENRVPSFREVWPDITVLRPSQRTLEAACGNGISPGLAIIEAPMGEGKTESAIYLAECWRLQHGAAGAYIALPTMATSNQMHHRYRDFLDVRRPYEATPRLVHGMSWLVDDVSPQADTHTCSENPGEERLLARDWFSPSKRALIAPEGVGTIDQVLMAALNVKHGFLRLLGLSSKVLIIDEVHAYDEYMTTILERLLEWCRVLKVPVIMLSATLSMPQKKRLIEAYGGALAADTPQPEPYPLITVVPMSGEDVKTLPVEAQSTPAWCR